MSSSWYRSLCLALSLSFGAPLWMGCGDDEGGTETDGSTAQADGSTSNPDGSVSNPDGNVSNPDGNVSNPDGNVSNPDGSVTPDGGAVGTACQDKFCSTGQKCCISFQGAMCIGQDEDCNGLSAVCDGKEDCTGDEVCCASFQDGASCAAQCDGQQLCNDNADCSGGQACCSFQGLGICFDNCPGT